MLGGVRLTFTAFIVTPSGRLHGWVKSTMTASVTTSVIAPVVSRTKIKKKKKTQCKTFFFTIFCEPSLSSEKMKAHTSCLLFLCRYPWTRLVLIRFYSKVKKSVNIFIRPHRRKPSLVGARGTSPDNQVHT